MSLFLVLLTAAWAHATPLSFWQQATVKLNSFPCLTETPRFEGSGLLFRVEDKIYVVTSEHVVIQDAGPSTCHQAEGEKLSLLVPDFESGLALLRVDTPSDSLRKRAVILGDLEGGTLGTALASLGFPSGSADLVTLSQGKLLTSDSRRALIAGIPALIEASGLPVEFGMSGGLLLSAQDKDFSFAGLLSHQVLRRESGRATKPIDIAPGPGSENDLTLAIPSTSVVSWIKAQLLVGNGSGWQRNAAAQLRGESALQFGPLLLTLKHAKAGDVWDIGGADWGGSDGSGIGGGEDEEKPGETIPFVELEFLPGITPADKTRVLGDPSLTLWRDWLLTGKKVRLVFLQQPNIRRLTRVQSLAQVLTFWQRDGYRPIALRSRDNNLQTEGEILLRRARLMETLAQGARDSSNVLEKKAWFAMLRDNGALAENALATSAEILGLLDGANDQYWREFYDTDFDAAVALEAAIQGLAEQMKKMGL